MAIGKSHPEPQILHFGTEREPVVILDGFSSAFADLYAAACRQTYAVTSPHYPGIRAQADASYLGERMDLLQSVLTDIFDCAQGARLVECAYSIVTTPPDRLSLIQSLPHFDSADPGRLALLHYFKGNETGGTAFFRHVRTGFETVTESRLKTYEDALREDIDEAGPPEPDYYRTGGAFEQIGEVEAKPNRMIIYRGYRLHSGIIPTGAGLSADPATGRLTLNTFLQAR